MPRTHHPRRGSEQFWPRARAKPAIARVRSWVKESKVKPLGFIAFKAGMTHIQVKDNHPKSLTKGETINLPTTILECPPLSVAGIVFYKKSNTGMHVGAFKVGQVMAEKLSKDLGRQIQLPKKTSLSKVADIKEFDDLRLLVHTNPHETSTGARKPELVEIGLGGSKDEKLKYAQDVLGKEIKINDVFGEGNQVDVHGITIGKGFQGTVKRFGVPIRQHKAEKTKRGIGTLGSWTPKRVQHTVAQSGKMGFHLRTEYNKQILKIGTNGKEVTPSGGLPRYGVVDNTYLLVKGSVAGPKKRAVLMTPALRPSKKMVKEAPEISFISVRN